MEPLARRPRSRTASSFFGAPMFESSSVISDMPSSASVTDGTARRADASPAAAPRLLHHLCSESLATARRFTGCGRNLTTAGPRSAMLVPARASGFIPPWSVPHARPTRLAASTDSTIASPPSPNCSTRFARGRRRRARRRPARAVEQFGDRARCKTAAAADRRAHGAGARLRPPELGALLGVLARRRRSSAPRSRAATAARPRRCASTCAGPRATPRALVGVRSEADEDEATTTTTTAARARRRAAPTGRRRARARSRPRRVRALIRDGAADALRGFASPRAAAADGFEATLRAQPFAAAHRARTTVVSATQRAPSTSSPSCA